MRGAAEKPPLSNRTTLPTQLPTGSRFCRATQRQEFTNVRFASLLAKVAIKAYKSLQRGCVQ